MEFTDAYFEDEVRDGFYVSSMMKKAWAAQLEVLYEVQQLCERHNIQYFAEWGTLLGAVRHGGMIPWDDDLDICMLSKDYKRFFELKDELPEEFSVSEYHTNESDNMVIRVNNSEKIIVDAKYVEKFHGFPYVAGIDIFRLDYLPKDKDAMKTHHDMVLIIGRIIGITIEVEKSDGTDQDLLESQEKYLSKLEEMCHVKFNRNERIKKQLYHFLQEEVGDLYDAASSDEVTNLPRWSENIDFRFPKKCYEGAITIPFENIEMALPVGYDELLRRKYGKNNMEPIRAGSSHEYPYYDAFCKYLVENTSANVYQYVYDKEEVEEVNREKQIQREENIQNSVQYLQQFVPLFGEIHANIIDFIKKGDNSTACGLIGECQNTAIEIGNQIEQDYTENVDVIKTLEGYCEFLFRVYNQLIESDSQQANLDEVQQAFVDFPRQLENDIAKLIKRKEIVFIPYKASYWNTMYTAWNEAMADDNTDVYVIPAPYYYKDAWGRVKKDNIQYETEGYPQEVILTDYNDYNFEMHHPDEIVIQCPYDEYNYAMTIHPFFYAKNLAKYTKQLVYIPALIMDEVEADDSRAKKMLKAYCNTPGAVFADQVIVQSEQMKEVYVELLTEFAGEETKDVWQNKIVSGDFEALSQINGKEKASIELPKEWQELIKKPDGTQKKIVLYTTSASALYCHEDKMLDKMSEVFEKYKAKQDEVAFWWYPDAKVRDVLRKSCPGILRKYRELVQQYKEEAWGIWDDSRDYERAIVMCDEVFGDGGMILNLCRNAKKAVTVQEL